MPDTTLHYTKWAGVRVDNVLVTETGLRGTMSEAALSNFFAEFNSTEPCAPAVKVDGGVKLRYCLCDETHVAKTDSASVALHPECGSGWWSRRRRRAPTDIENYTPTRERFAWLSTASTPTSPRSSTRSCCRPSTRWPRSEGAYPQEQFNFFFLANTSFGAAPPLASPRLAKLQLVAETTSWHDLHGTRVKTVFTGNAAPPPMDMYSWARIVANATLVNGSARRARALPQVHRRRAREAAARHDRVDAHPTRR